MRRLAADGSAPLACGDGGLSPRASDAVSPLRQEIDRWFARRGVPQLIEGYSSESAMDKRAAPLISLWLIVGTVIWWGTRPDWPPPMNLAGIAGTIGWMGLVWWVVSRLRGRSPRIRPSTFDLWDILTIAFLPALPAAVIEASPTEAIAAFLGALTGVGAIYGIVGFGLIEIGAWAFERLWEQVTHVVELLARTLPVLLILVVFLLFAAEIWEAAHAMSWLELGLVLLLLLVLAALLVSITFRRELLGIEARTDIEGVLADAVGTPAEPLIAGSGEGVLPAPRLPWLQRTNVTLLVAIPQLLQAIAVGAVVMGFLVLFALIAVPASVQAAWIGAPPRELVAFVLLDEQRTLSEELVIVSAVLGGIVGLYFSGLGITDPTTEPRASTARSPEFGRSWRCARCISRRFSRAGPDAPRLPGGNRLAVPTGALDVHGARWPSRPATIGREGEGLLCVVRS